MYGRVVLSRNNAAATEHPLASLAALEILKAGGNAFDAAVAASFSLAVVQHHLGGVGGDFFALLYQADKETTTCLNASGWAPSGLTVDALTADGHMEMPSRGAFSVTIPGLVKGIHSMHQRFGRLEFSSLLAGAIELAENGFPIGYELARATEAKQDLLPQPARRMLTANGKPMKPGDILRQQKLGAVLRAIAEKGPDAFYNGWIAESICGKLTENGVEVSIHDFSAFEPEWCDPITGTYRDFTVHEIPPNSMGATSLLILELLKETELGRLKPDSSERIGITLEAVRAAYRERDESLADPRFAPFDLQRFLFRDHSEGRKQPTMFSIHGNDTTYYAIVDSKGNVVSGIQSLFEAFGSEVFVEDCGIFLNNRASGFTLTGPNKVEPRKRPMHTLSTLLIGKNAKPKVAVGCSGGNFRPQQHALFVTNLVDYSMSLEQAIDFPRFLLMGNDKLRVEAGYRNLETLGLEIESIRYPAARRETGVAQGIEILPNAKKAICDVRGDGIPIGN